MHNGTRNKWLLAAVLLSLPQFAFAMGGEGIFGGLIIVLLFFLAVAGLLIILMAVFIYKRSTLALYTAVGSSVFASMGYILRNTTSSTSREEMVFLALWVGIPFLFAAMLLVAALVRSMTVRGR